MMETSERKRKIRVRFIIALYTPLYSGAAKSLEKLIKGFDKKKYEIEIITSYKKGLKRYERFENVSILRVGGNSFTKKGLLSMKGKISFMISAFLYSLLHKEVDIIHFIGIGKVFFPSLLVYKIRRKVVAVKYTRRGDDSPDVLYRSFLGRLILKLVRNDIHWFISEELYRLYLKIFKVKPAKYVLAPNPVVFEYENWEDLCKDRDIFSLKGEIRFLFVGLIGRTKGADILLNIWNKINPNAKLILVGPLDYDDREFVEYFLKLKERNKNVIYKGVLDFEELKALYMSCDCFLFPSRLEGLPNVLLEAMSYGLPIMANFLEGVTDFLLGKESERGILIKKNDMNQWIEHINSYINSKEYRESLKNKARLAFEWARENADLKSVASKLDKVYSEQLKYYGYDE